MGRSAGELVVLHRTKSQPCGSMNIDNPHSALRNTIISFQDAFNAGDLSTVVLTFEHNGIVMPNNGPAAQGHPSIQALYQSLFNTFAITMSYTIEEQVMAGEYAFVRTSSQVLTHIRASGETISLLNKELFVLRREADQWKISQYIFNNTAKN